MSYIMLSKVIKILTSFHKDNTKEKLETILTDITYNGHKFHVFDHGYRKESISEELSKELCWIPAKMPCKETPLEKLIEDNIIKIINDLLTDVRVYRFGYERRFISLIQICIIGRDRNNHILSIETHE